ARKPPADRFVLLAQVLVRVTVGPSVLELPGFEFPGALHPAGHKVFRDFHQNASVRLTWQTDKVRVTQEIILARGRNAAAIQWKVDTGGPAAKVALLPLVANRGFHTLRRKPTSPDATVSGGGSSASVRFNEADAPTLELSVPGSEFTSKPDWWYNFVL